jgi:hypothetical protein
MRHLYAIVFLPAIYYYIQVYMLEKAYPSEPL